MTLSQEVNRNKVQIVEIYLWRGADKWVLLPLDSKLTIDGKKKTWQLTLRKNANIPLFLKKKSNSSCKNEPEADECSSMAQQCVDSVRYEPSDSAINSNRADTACLSI